MQAGLLLQRCKICTRRPLQRQFRRWRTRAGQKVQVFETWPDTGFRSRTECLRAHFVTIRMALPPPLEVQCFVLKFEVFRYFCSASESRPFKRRFGDSLCASFSAGRGSLCNLYHSRGSLSVRLSHRLPTLRTRLPAMRTSIVSYLASSPVLGVWFTEYQRLSRARSLIALGHVSLSRSNIIWAKMVRLLWFSSCSCSSNSDCMAHKTAKKAGVSSAADT